jgi:hypothetical protein
LYLPLERQPLIAGHIPVSFSFLAFGLFAIDEAENLFESHGEKKRTAGDVWV